MKRLLSSLRHPFSGLSHLMGALLSLVGVIFLLQFSQGHPWHLTCFAIYGASLVLLYSASALYHLLRVSPARESQLYGLDRAAIYGLIAGTYTPVCLLALPPAWGWSLLGVVWVLAIGGIIADAVSRHRIPDWLQASLYLATGWAVLVGVRPLVNQLPAAALGWLLAGSLLYTGGAVICVLDRPRLRPGVFGAHDLWHVLVLAASACHFVLMRGYLAPG